MPPGWDPSAAPARGRHRAAEPGVADAYLEPGAPPAEPVSYVPPPFGAIPAAAPFYGPPPSLGPVSSYEPPPSTYVPPMPFGQSPEPQFVPYRTPRRGRRLLGVAVVTVLAVAVVLGGAFVLLHRSTTHPAAHAALPSVADFPKTSAQPALPTTTPTRIPTGHRVMYRSAEGHFSATFPHEPATQSIPGSSGGHHYALHLAADPYGGTVVEEVEFGSVKPSDIAPMLDALANELSSSSALSVQSVRPTTFHGRPARLVRLVDAKVGPVTAVVASYPAGRVYALLSQAGAPFAALEKSFVALP